MDVKILEGDVLETLKQIEAGSVQTCVTSPPYYGLRSYLKKDDPLKALEIGSEATPEEYVNKLVQVFREVWRVLADDGTLWLNLGDSYWGGKGQSSQAWSTEHQERDTLQKAQHQISGKGETRPTDGKHPVIKSKDLIGIPWMVAFALRAEGWYLRQDIIWHKPNPMPESVTDRCTKAHEYIFLLSKSRQYYYDHEAIKEPATDTSISRWAQDVENQKGSDRVPGKTNGRMKAVGGYKNLEDKGQQVHSMHVKRSLGEPEYGLTGNGFKGHSGNKLADGTVIVDRNKRSVWTVTTKPYKEAHFATFPPDLIEPCILAGSAEGDTVLDPFGGSGTVAGVAIKHGRNAVLCELNHEYIPLIKKRLSQVQPIML